MKQTDYSGQAFLHHLENTDKSLIQRVDELDDSELKNTIYDVAQIVTKFATDEDENVLHAIDFLEDKIDALTSQVSDLQKGSKHNGI